MRKVLYLLIIPAILVGCAKVKEAVAPQEHDGLHEVVFHAGWDSETRTVLQEDGSVWWSPGDEISLFVGNDNDGVVVGSGSDGGYRLKANNTIPSASVDFVGHMDTESIGSSCYYALYPYDSNASFKDGVVYTSIPSLQYAKAGTVSEKQLVSLAVSDNETLSFMNICGGIKFSVANPGITKVVFKDHVAESLYADNSPIAGNVKVSGIDCEPMYDGSESLSVTVLPLESDSFEPGKYYYVTMIPKTFNDLDVRYYKGDLVASYRLTYDVVRETHKTPSINRAVFKRVYDKDANLVFSKAYNTYAVIGTNSILPTGVDKTIITEAVFHTSTDHTTDLLLVPSNEPEGNASIYFDLDGTVAHYYTSADRYQIREAGWLFGGWSCLKNLDLSMFSTESVTDMSYMFSDCVNLENLDVSGFNTGNVETMTGMFKNCRHLKALDISGFSSNRLVDAGYLFFRCLSLTNLDLGSFEMPKSDESASWYSVDGVAQLSKNCGIRCSARTKDILCELESGLQEYIQYITWFLPEEVLPVFEPQTDPSMYCSSDFSVDKKVKMLHSATEGNGIDIVLMGDAYSDRLIADGTYENDMETAMEEIFSLEPFKSHKQLFNVYLIYAVSKNESLGEDCCFDSKVKEVNYSGDLDGLWCDYTTIRNYAMIASQKTDSYLVFPVMIMNSDIYGGFASMNSSWNENDKFDYPANIESIAVVSRDRDGDSFHNVVCHEFGHSFAALFEEYVDRSYPMEEWEVNFMKNAFSHVGWWSNVDFTSDPATIKWSRFLEDPRYDSSQVSIIEGARHATGIWKSVDQSMMNSGGEFSVPAREAIYKKIHKLAYGEDWQYDYETFVEFDRKSVAATQAAPTPLFSPVAAIHKKPIIKIEQSAAPDGQKRISVIMN